MVSNFYYITISTRPHHILGKLKQKVSENGETLIVLGENEKRIIGWEGSQNFGLKLKEVSMFINRNELEPDDIVLFTDAYDVVYFGNKNEIIERFLEFKKPVVFGCEKYCSPDPELAKNYNSNSSTFPFDYEFPYLNSGLFIGYVWALRKCISEYQYDDRDDDQRYWTKQLLEINPDLIQLDYMNRLFLNTLDIDMKKFEIVNGNVIYKRRRPIFVHVNSSDKRLIDELVG